MTAASFLAQIDWNQPWLAPFRAIATPIVQSADLRSALNTAAEGQNLQNHRNLPIRFVPQSDLPPGLAYETFISETGCVPTRDNLHDFFNALIWLSYPLTKARLNALQAAAIIQAHGTSVRGRLRDAITIFDENAAVFIAHDESLVEDLRSHEWERLFLEKREAFGVSYAVCLFGHAILEKLVTPYKAITAHAYPLLLVGQTNEICRVALPEFLDARLENILSAELNTRAFLPLPVFGLPGWSSEQDRAFYRDTSVFRPVRKKE